MLTIACCLWEPNGHSEDFSRCFDETWVEKLYRGFRRNLTRQFRFVCFTDRKRAFCAGVEQERLAASEPSYGCLMEPFKLNEPMIVCGLDMIVLRNIDHMADYCLTGAKIAAPIHPSKPQDGVVNPIVFVPAGFRRVFDEWKGENDMIWLRKFGPITTDSMWPGQILSLKLHDVRRKGTQDAHIIYFHGVPKPNQMADVDWVKENWR